jgi:hypothetical protein
MQNTVLLCETIRKNCPAIAANSLCKEVSPVGTFCGAAVDDSIISMKNSLIRCPEIYFLAEIIGIWSNTYELVPESYGLVR